MATVGGGAGLSTAGEYVLRTDTASDQLTIATPLGGGTGLTKSGLGTLVLASGNSYGGPTTIDAGTLKTTAAAAIPSTSPLVIANAAALDLGGQSQTVAGITLYDGAIENSGPAAVLTLGGNAAGVTYGGNGNGNGSSISGGTLDLASAGSSSASHTFSVARGQGSADLNVLADIADGSASSQALVKTGNGILQLSGANTFTGGTQIEAGTLTLGSNQAIPAASSLTLSAGTLDLGGYANTASTLVMKNGLITGNGSFSAASFNLQNGTVAGSLAGPGSISITASGVVTITGSNSYSGGTKLSGGTLTVSADNNLGAESGALTLDGGMLQVEGTSFSATTRPVTTTANGGTISVVDPNNTLTLATQNLNGSGAFTKAGQGGLQLGGSIGSTAITVQDGTLQLTGSASQLTANPALTLWNVATFSFSNHNESVSAINLTGGTINTGTGTLNLTGSLTYAQSIWPATIQGNLALGAAAGAFSVTQGDSTDLTVAANISGSPAGGLVKSGNGLLTLTGSNTYSGSTSISAGTLQMGNGGTSGTPGTGPIVDNAVLSFNRSDTFTLANAVSGSGSLLQSGLGTLQLTAANQYSGPTTVTAGTLQIGGGGTSGTPGTGPIVDNAVLLLNRSNTFTLANTVSGSGSLLQSGLGTVQLTAANSYSGGTTIADGTLNINADAALGALPPSPATNVTFSGDGTLQAGAATVVLSGNRNLAIESGVIVTIDTQSDAMTVPGIVSGPGGLTKIGGGTLTLSGADTYSGATTVDAGMLRLPATGRLGNTSITIGNGATFVPTAGAVVAGSTGNGSAGATLNLNPGAVFDMVDGAIGTFSLNQQSGFAGAALTINGATLEFDLSSSAADSLLVNTGAAAVSGTNTISIAGLGSSLTPGGTYTLISAPSGLNGTFLFPNSSTSEALTVGSTPYKLTLNSSAGTLYPGSAESVHVYGGTSYQLAATVANTTIIQGGSTTVTSIIQNTGTQTNNVPLDYSGLSVALSGVGSLGSLSQSGSGLSPTNSSSGACTFTSNVPGTATLTPVVGSASNDTIGGAASGAAPATVTVTVLGHSAPNLSVTSGNDQTVFVGATGISAGLNLSNGSLNQGGLALLDVNSLGAGVSGPTGFQLIASGATQSYTAALDASAPACRRKLFR